MSKSRDPNTAPRKTVNPNWEPWLTLRELHNEAIALAIGYKKFKMEGWTRDE